MFARIVARFTGATVSARSDRAKLKLSRLDSSERSHCKGLPVNNLRMFRFLSQNTGDIRPYCRPNRFDALL
jgi:hypothetical protein